MQRTSVHLESLKDIPGYKAIVKAVLHSQIQQLVEQLSQHAEEEAVFLTASLGDGSISDLGSGIGKDFLQEKDEVKSQFLRFCLKRHHMIKTDEKSGQSIEPRPIRVSRATSSPRPRHTPYALSTRSQKHVSGGTFDTPSGSSVNIFSNGENQTESSVNEMKQESICIQLADNDDDDRDNYGCGVGGDMDDYDVADEGLSDEFGDDHQQNSKLLETCKSGNEGNTQQSNVGGRETLMTSLTSTVDTDTGNNFTVKIESSGLQESDIQLVEMDQAVFHSGTVSDMPVGTGLDQSGHHGYSGAAGTSADIQGNNEDSMQKTYGTELFGDWSPIDCHAKEIRSRKRKGEIPIYAPITPTDTQCPYCKQNYANNANLKRHIRKHEGTYPYQCEACHMKFSDPTIYKRHVTNMKKSCWLFYNKYVPPDSAVYQ